MTIAIGIIARDGIVLAADSQLTVPGYLKLDQGKISGSIRAAMDGDRIRGMAIAGAGAESSLSYMRQKLGDWFTAHDPAPKPEQVRQELESQIQEFHATHVTPHGRGEMDVWMLLAARSGHDQNLFSTDKTIVLDHPSFAAVGVGHMYARSLLSRLYGSMDTMGAILLASYVVLEVKQFIDGCGNATDIIGLHGGGWYIIDRKVNRKLEEIFEHYSRVRSHALHEFFGGHIRSHGWSMPKVSSETRKLQKEIAQVVGEIQRPRLDPAGKKNQARRVKRSATSQT